MAAVSFQNFIREGIMEDNKDLEKTVEEESKEVEAAEVSEKPKAEASD